VGCLLEALAHTVFEFLVRMVLLPVILVLCTPFILVAAVTRPRQFHRRTVDFYRGVANWYLEVMI
jgi:hypothetical protein